MSLVTTPIYILGPNDQTQARFYTDKTGGDLCENVTYLGKQYV